MHLELGVLSLHSLPEDGKIIIQLKEASECIPQKHLLQYDKAGDNHYDTIPAFIKTACVVLIRMLLFITWQECWRQRREDIKFIARRIMIVLPKIFLHADPQVLFLAVLQHRKWKRLGMPEARIVLAQTSYLRGMCS